MDQLIIAILASGHVLLEDVPGTGKTLLAKAVAKSIDGAFKRIQFTPDLLPSDLTGIHFYNQKLAEFEFRPGPLFANIVLADEINRATPRTQSSLLECMEERQVSIDGETHLLGRPFLVIATQNPIEQQGTFPLPEAQLDRFLFKLKMGYPTTDEGIAIMKRFMADSPAGAASSRRDDRADRGSQGGSIRRAGDRRTARLYAGDRGSDAQASGRGAWRESAQQPGAVARLPGQSRDPGQGPCASRRRESDGGAGTGAPDLARSVQRMRADAAENVIRRILASIPVPADAPLISRA